MLNQIKKRPGLFISEKVYNHYLNKDAIKILRLDKYCVRNGYKQWTFSEYWICACGGLYDNIYIEGQHFVPGSFRKSRLSEIFIFMNARIRYRYERRKH